MIFARAWAFAICCLPTVVQAKPVVAVFEIEDSRASAALTHRELRDLTGYLADKLAESGKYKIVPNADIKRALADRKALSYNACYDESCQITIGKEIAAEKSLSTKISEFGGACFVRSALFDLKESATDKAATHKTSCNKSDFLSALDVVVGKLTGVPQDPPSASPSTSNASPKTPNASPNASSALRSARRLGKAGAFGPTIAATTLEDALYTIEASGALYVTDLKSGTFRQLGKKAFGGTRFLVSAKGALFTIERNGSLYRIDPTKGTWRRIGKKGAWKATIAATVLDDKLYTIEQIGALYVTDLQNGTYRKLGKNEFGSTRFFVAARGALFTIETTGSLFRIDPTKGTWRRIGRKGAWRPTIAATAHKAMLYTIEGDGALFKTEVEGGNYQKLGQKDFLNTSYFVATKQGLFTITAKGDLLAVTVD